METVYLKQTNESFFENFYGNIVKIRTVIRNKL